MQATKCPSFCRHRWPPSSGTAQSQSALHAWFDKFRPAMGRGTSRHWCGHDSRGGTAFRGLCGVLVVAHTCSTSGFGGRFSLCCGFGRWSSTQPRHDWCFGRHHRLRWRPAGCCDFGSFGLEVAKFAICPAEEDHAVETSLYFCHLSRGIADVRSIWLQTSAKTRRLLLFVFHWIPCYGGWRCAFHWLLWRLGLFGQSTWLSEDGGNGFCKVSLYLVLRLWLWLL